MSVTLILVYDHARRIPVRGFKIHKQCALAMKFTPVAVGQATIRTGVAVAPRLWFVQHVGVAPISTLKLIERAVQTKNIRGFTASKKSLSYIDFWGPRFAFPLSHYLRKKKIERIFR